MKSHLYCLFRKEECHIMEKSHSPWKIVITWLIVCCLSSVRKKYSNHMGTSTLASWTPFLSVCGLWAGRDLCRATRAMTETTCFWEPSHTRVCITNNGYWLVIIIDLKKYCTDNITPPIHTHKSITWNCIELDIYL